jgi:hypothetical protein
VHNLWAGGSLELHKERVFRIGEKLISLDKVLRQVEKVLEMREIGHSQQEIATMLHLIAVLFPGWNRSVRSEKAGGLQ